jgi:NADH:ubiquinone oxidoreductase subunit 6 (subunit J)
MKKRRLFMHPEQIHGELKTRYRLKRYESLKRSTNRYFLAVCVLFLALALMCANNVAVYNSYMEVKSDFDAAAQSVKAVQFLLFFDYLLLP